MTEWIESRALQLNLPATEWRLCCPHCGSPYDMHHHYVTCYEREREDGDTTEIRVEKRMSTTLTIPDAVSRNPSSRRGAVAIGFVCTTCGMHAELTFVQHKGETQITWRDIVPSDKKNRTDGAFTYFSGRPVKPQPPKEAA